MKQLWQPENSPPQVSEAAERSVIDQVLAEGVERVSGEALANLESDHEPLIYYLDRFGFQLNDISREGLWPERVLKVGAGLTLLAYRETGYFQKTPEDVFDLSTAMAELDGIPQAYFSCLFDDKGLLKLMSEVGESKSFTAPDPSGYHQILDIGAGCVRFHFKNVLEAA